MPDHWRREAGAKGGMRPGWRHSKEDKKFPVCVRSFKCITALYIRPPEVFVTFKMCQIHLRPGLSPIRTLGSSPHSLVG